jgi:DNA topoisomerase-1
MVVAVRRVVVVLIALLLWLPCALGARRPTGAAAKFEAVDRFRKALPSLRKKVATTLAHPAADKPTALAAIIRIMDATGMRVGSQRYARGKRPTYGASSMLKRFVEVRGDRITFDFRGKDRVHWTPSFRDPALAGALRLFRAQPGPRLFPGVDGSDVRGELPGDALSKDLRTIRANAVLDEELAALGDPPSKAKLSLAIEQVAKRIFHEDSSSTRRHYLDPRKLRGYQLRIKAFQATARTAPPRARARHALR